MPDDPAASSWSATGAVIAAARIRPPATKGETLGETSFGLAMDALATTVGAGLQSWNDRPERHQNDVLEAFRAARRLLLTDRPARSPG